MGRTGLKVSAVSIGTMFFGTQVNEAEAIKILDTAFDKGVNLFDTADAYAGGKSEEIVGKAIQNKRQSVVSPPKSGINRVPAPMIPAFPASILSGELKSA
jgi:aryl-alcohol dehydrogenase (NADP+)